MPSTSEPEHVFARLRTLRGRRRRAETNLAEIKRAEGQVVRQLLDLGVPWSRIAEVAGFTSRGLHVRHPDLGGIDKRKRRRS